MKKESSEATTEEKKKELEEKKKARSEKRKREKEEKKEKADEAMGEAVLSLLGEVEEKVERKAARIIEEDKSSSG